MPRIRIVLRRLAAGLVALGVGLGFAELALRWLAPQPVFIQSSRTYAPDPPGRYGLRPGYRGRVTNRTEFDHEVVISADGMRQPQLAAKTPGRPRVLFLGDSFTFGTGVEQTQAFPARVEAELAARGIASETVNGGIPGFGTDDEATWLEIHGAAIDPDFIVLAVFVGNDIQNAEPSYRARRVDDDHADIASEESNLRTWLYYNSHLYLLVKHAIPRRAMNRMRTAVGIEAWFSQGMIDELSPCALRPPPWVAEAVSITGDALDRILTFARSRGVAVVATLLPDVTAVDREAWDQALRQLNLAPADYDLDRCDAIYVDLLGSRGVPTLDLRPALRAALAAGERPYFRYDRHFSVAGQRLAGREVARFLETHLPPLDGAGP